MSDSLELENIEEMRLRAGIDDVELRMGIRRLKAGDFVKISMVTGAASFETVSVRITSIRGSAFRGKLNQRGSALLKLGAGAIIAFNTAHIHSIAKTAAITELPGP